MGTDTAPLNDIASANHPLASTLPAFDWSLAESGYQYDPLAALNDITRALLQIRARFPFYEMYSAYYEGRHRFNFATEKFRNTFGSLFHSLTDNLCAVCVDAPADRMLITGFAVEEGAAGLSQDCDEVWQFNRMDERASLVHKEALREGDAYVIVWPDEAGEPVIWPQRAAMTTVYHDQEHPERLLWAAKLWLDAGGFARLNMYYAERIEKYTSTARLMYSLPDDTARWVPAVTEGEGWPLANPYGRVPVFHFANNAWIASFGRSEIASVVPLQDALNKALCDMMVAMEFAAMPQRWATGLELDTDSAGKPVKPFETGIDRIWAVANETVKFGQFDSANLKNFIEVQESLRGEIARVSGLPPYYFMPSTGSWPSGESLKTAESRLTTKVRNRESGYGNTWEDCMAFALLIRQGVTQIRLSTQWQDPAPVSEAETLANLTVKKKLGVSTQQILSEAGYGDQDVVRMMTENKANAPAFLQPGQPQPPQQPSQPEDTAAP
jgi:hypothetical protein